MKSGEDSSLQNPPLCGDRCVFMHVCVAAVRGIYCQHFSKITASIMLFISSPDCRFFVFWNDKSALWENLSTVTFTQCEGILSESFFLFLYWQLWTASICAKTLNTNHCRGFVSAYQWRQFSLITVRPVKCIKCHQAILSWHTLLLMTFKPPHSAPSAPRNNRLHILPIYVRILYVYGYI